MNDSLQIEEVLPQFLRFPEFLQFPAMELKELWELAGTSVALY